MRKLIIIADDLTGANATGVLLARQGYRTTTFLHLAAFSEERHQAYSVVAINTDSRAIAPDEAYRRVATTTQAFANSDVALFSKRIDSTMRGNVGAEIDAVLDTLGPDYLAIVVAAFPNSGRVTVGGYLMVNSIPLERTDVARDPKTPVEQSVVPELIAGQSKYPVGQIGLRVVLKGASAIAAAILELRTQGKRVMVVDATTNDDLGRIAVAVKQAGVKAVAVDPGPFTEALTKLVLPSPNLQHGQKVLMVVGSVTPLTRQQLRDADHHYHPWFVTVDAEVLIDETTLNSEAQRVADEILTKIDEYEVLCIRTVRDDSDIIDLKAMARKHNLDEDGAAERIAAGLARVAKQVIVRSAGAIGALYTSGGDVTVAVCRELGAEAIEVKDEVLPLAAYGRILGGKWANTPIITKGGLVGGPDAATQSIKYLLTKVSTELVPVEK